MIFQKKRKLVQVRLSGKETDGEDGYSAGPKQIHFICSMGLAFDRFFCFLGQVVSCEESLSLLIFMKFLLGKKLGMTTIHDPEKGARNVTLIECDANTVTLARLPERDGYAALQVETSKTRRKNTRREFRLDTKMSETESAALLESLPVGSVVPMDVFVVGERVSVSGVTKAKGFQGVVKRHGFKGAPKTHGHKHDLRAPGSIGATFPQHVIKGMRMAGRMGGVRATTRNLSVSYVDAEKRLIGVRGAVPGSVGSIVEIRSAK